MTTNGDATDDTVGNDNMYGYTDYAGPGVAPPAPEEDEDDDAVFTVGLWMEGDSLAPPCGASVPVIHAMLGMIDPWTADDVLYDLGCGDGRVCLEAAYVFGCRRCVGVELEHDLVARCRQLIRQEEEKRGKNEDVVVVQAVQGDLRDVLDRLLSDDTDESSSLPAPTVVCLYLLPEAIATIQPRLERLLRRYPGLRILCNTWGLQDLRAVASIEATDGDGGSADVTLFAHASLSP